MATAARKARKRAGIKFEKSAKVGTPLEERAEYYAPVWGAPSTKFQGASMPRSAKKQKRMRDARILTS